MLLKGQLNICKDNEKDSALESVNLIHCEKLYAKNGEAWPKPYKKKYDRDFFQALMMDHFTKIVNS